MDRQELQDHQVPLGLLAFQALQEMLDQADLLGILVNPDRRVLEEILGQLVALEHLDLLVHLVNQVELEIREILVPQVVLDLRDLLDPPDREAVLDHLARQGLEEMMVLQALLEG